MAAVCWGDLGRVLIESYNSSLKVGRTDIMAVSCLKYPEVFGRSIGVAHVRRVLW